MQIKATFLSLSALTLLILNSSTEPSAVPIKCKNLTSNVHIILTEGFGRDIGSGIVKSFKNTDGKDFAKSFHENNAFRIPYGIYDMEMEKDAWSPASREVHIYSPDVWIVVGMKGGEDERQCDVPQVSLNGKIIHSSRADEPIYLRLVGLYSGFLADERMQFHGEVGTFQFAGNMPYGKYLLLIRGNQGLLCTQELAINTYEERIEVDLSGSACSELRKANQP